MPTAPYIRQLWANFLAGNTPLSAERLNTTEAGLKNASDGVVALEALKPVGVVAQSFTAAEQDQARANTASASQTAVTAAATAASNAGTLAQTANGNALTAIAQSTRRVRLTTQASNTSQTPIPFVLDGQSSPAGRYLVEVVGRCAQASGSYAVRLGVYAPGATIDTGTGTVEQHTSSTGVRTVTAQTSTTDAVGISPGSSFLPFAIRAVVSLTTATQIGAMFSVQTAGGTAYIEAGAILAITRLT